MAAPRYRVILRRSGRQSTPRPAGQDPEADRRQGRSPPGRSSSPELEKLSGRDDLYRIKSGDYRIVYTIVDRTLTVLVVKVGDRKDIYRKLP